MRDSVGHSVRLSQFKGRAVLLTFIYTHCPDVCPLIVAHLHNALLQLGTKARQVQVVAVSVDPRGDAAYLAHEEAKSNGPDGQPCGPSTVGLLQRRPVTVRTVTHIGKEANQLEDTLTGLNANQDETLNNYDDTERIYFRDHVVPLLRETLGTRGTARRLDFNVGTVRARRRTSANPNP